MRKTLILGGGWVGCRITASSPSQYVTTKRTQVGVDSLVQLGIQCILFDAEKESTWEEVIECRNSFELHGIVITFPLTESLVAHLENLLKKLRCTGVPIVCLSTMSVFGPTHYLDIVTEEWPLEGISQRNEPLTERISAEKSLIVNHGACILHLSGICGDEDDDLPGGDRYIKNWIIKGYIKANWMLVNLIHIKDIIAIIELALSAKLQGSFREKRLILSSGAYRRRDLFKAVGLQLPPHDLPFDNNGHPLDSVKKSRIMSLAKLLEVVGLDYEFVPPLPGMQPASQGLPSSMLPLAERLLNPEWHDRQWELFKKYHSGKWEGESYTFMYGGCDLGTLKNGGEISIQPILFKDACSIAYFLDHDNCYQKEKNSLFPTGVEVMVNRKTFDRNSLSKFFAFPCVTGVVSNGYQSEMKCEINFFFEKQRYALFHVWKESEGSTGLILKEITVSVFHCEDCENEPIKKPTSTVSELLEDLPSLTGKRTYSSKAKTPTDDTVEIMKSFLPTPAIDMFLQPQPSHLVQSFCGNLVVSLPCTITKGSAYDVVVGCRPSASLFQVCTVSYDDSGTPNFFSVDEYYKP